MIAEAPLLGVFGGTFDPVHLGHTGIAQATFSLLQLDRLHIIPAAQSPFKPQTSANPEQRLQMLRLAMPESAGIFLDLREYQRNEPSYTVTTLEELKIDYPRHHLVLLLGADAFAGLPRWYRSTKLPELTHLVMMNRHGITTPALQAKGFKPIEPGQLRQQAAGGLLTVTVPSPDLSSSDLRSKIAAGQNVGTMLCSAVWSYIQQHRLYGFVGVE